MKPFKMAGAPSSLAEAGERPVYSMVSWLELGLRFRV